MTPDRINRLRAACRHTGAGSAATTLQLIEHVERLQDFIHDLTEHYAQQPGAGKTAAHHRLMTRAHQLRAEFAMVSRTTRNPE